MTPERPLPATPLRLGRLFIYIGAILLTALTAFALLRAAAFYTLYTWLLAQVLDISGLDVWASRAIAVGLLAVLWLVPWHLVLIPWIGGAKRQVVTLLFLAAAALALGAMEFATQDVYFSRADGRPLKYYIQTLDGYKFSSTPGTDPVYGIPYQRITGTKTNVVFFTKGQPTQTMLIYDARTNVAGITKKDRVLTPEHFKEFEKCFGSDPNGRAKRKTSDSKEDRWHSFTIAEVKERHFKIDSLKWLKDDSLDDADDLPEPEELATDAIAELESAVEELNSIIVLLENGNGNGAAPTKAAKKV